MHPNYYEYATFISGRCYLVTGTLRNAIAMARKYDRADARITRTHMRYRTGRPRYSGPVTIWERHYAPIPFEVIGGYA